MSWVTPFPALDAREFSFGLQEWFRKLGNVANGFVRGPVGGSGDRHVVLFNGIDGLNLLDSTATWPVASPQDGQLLSSTPFSIMSWTFNIPSTNDITTNTTYYPLFQTSVGGANPVKTSDTKLQYNPSSGLLSSSALSINGIAGAGYLDLPGQSPHPTNPVAGTVRLHGVTRQGITTLEFVNESTDHFIIPQDSVTTVRNSTGSTISIGQVLYVAGQTGTVPDVALAKANASTTLPAVFIATNQILSGAFGQAMRSGILNSFDTNLFTAGQILYVSPTVAGGLTATRPSGTTNFAQKVGTVLVSGVGNGAIDVEIAGSALNAETGTNASTWTGTHVVATDFTGALLGNATTATDASNAVNSYINNDVASGGPVYPAWVNSIGSGSAQPLWTSGSNFAFYPSIGQFNALAVSAKNFPITSNGSASAHTLGTNSSIYNEPLTISPIWNSASGGTAGSLSIAGGTATDGASGNGGNLYLDAGDGFTTHGSIIIGANRPSDINLNQNPITYPGEIGSSAHRASKVWGNALDISASVNGNTDVTVTNTSSGSTASAGWFIVNDSSYASGFGMLSSGWTTNGILVANAGLLSTSGPGGLSIISQAANSPIVFAAGGLTETARLTSAGVFSVTDFNGTIGVTVAKTGAFTSGAFSTTVAIGTTPTTVPFTLNADPVSNGIFFIKPKNALSAGNHNIWRYINSAGTSTRFAIQEDGTTGLVQMVVRDTASIQFGAGGAITFPGSITVTGDATLSGSNSTTVTQSPGDNSTKIATTAYVAAAVSGISFKAAVKYATVAVLPNPTVVYANGALGVGATLTAGANAALSVDGNTPSVNDRILVKNQATNLQNGIYTVTTVGDGSNKWVLTRATDADQSAEYTTGFQMLVITGTANANTTWAYNGVSSPTMGTTSLTFVETAGINTYTAGANIGISGGNQISVIATLPVSVGGTGTTTFAAGGLLYGNTTSAVGASAAGTTGQAAISGGTGVPTWYVPTLGSVLFAGTSGILDQDNSNFFWDASTHRLGLGTATPGRTLTISAPATTGTLVGNRFVISDFVTSTFEHFQSTAENQWRSNVAIGLAANNNAVSDLYINTSGNSGFGTGTTVSARVHSISTTEQLRLGYDASNYVSNVVGADSGLTLTTNSTGATAGTPYDFSFNGHTFATGGHTYSTARMSLVQPTADILGTNSISLGPEFRLISNLPIIEGQNGGIVSFWQAISSSVSGTTAVAFGTGGATTNTFSAMQAGGINVNFDNSSNTNYRARGDVDIQVTRPFTAWATGLPYTRGWMVTDSGTTYICNLDHVSGIFATDAAAGYWTTTGSEANYAVIAVRDAVNAPAVSNPGRTDGKGFHFQIVPSVGAPHDRLAWNIGESNNRFSEGWFAGQLTSGPGTSSAGRSSSYLYTSNTGDTYITARDSTNSVEAYIGVSSVGGFVGTQTNHDLSFQAAAVTRMTINQSTGIVSAVNGFSGSGAGLTSIPNSATTATDANTANAIIARDDSKNFIANVMTGSSTTVLSQNGTNKITFNVLYHVGLDVYVDGTKFAQILFDTNYT